MMTPKERTIAALSLEESDRVPFTAPPGVRWPTRLSKIILKHTDLGLRSFPPAPPNGWDHLGVFFGNLKGHMTKEVLSEMNGSQTVRYVIKTPRGPIQMITRRYLEAMGMIDWRVEPFAKNWDDVEKFLSLPYEPLAPSLMEKYRKERRHGEDALISAAFADAVTLPFFLFGFTRAIVECYRNYDMIDMLLKLGQERLREYIEQLLSFGVRYFFMVGPEIVSIYMPRFFDKIVVQYDKQLIDIIHKEGGFVNWHQDGPIMNFLEKIASAGADALNPLEPAPPLGHGDVKSLEDVKKRIGDRVCLWGNVSYLELMDSGKSVDGIVRSRIEAAAEGGGLVLSYGFNLYARACDETVPYERGVEYIKVALKYGKYPIRT